MKTCQFHLPFMFSSSHVNLSSCPLFWGFCDKKYGGQAQWKNDELQEVRVSQKGVKWPNKFLRWVLSSYKDTFNSLVIGEEDLRWLAKNLGAKFLSTPYRHLKYGKWINSIFGELKSFEDILQGPRCKINIGVPSTLITKCVLLAVHCDENRWIYTQLKWNKKWGDLKYTSPVKYGSLRLEPCKASFT